MTYIYVCGNMGNNLYCKKKPTKGLENMGLYIQDMHQSKGKVFIGILFTWMSTKKAERY